MRSRKAAPPPACEDTMLTREFGLAIRRLREARGWSQERLAEAADMNRSYIGEVERGAAIPSLVTIDKLAAALGTSASGVLAHCELALAEAL
ncbi:helix-turn-helix domain-containing protein [Duganella sp. FT92W]|uniref:Helix-turn-helix domain-containing protein n=2 Tax=Pseudoduganella rivuli TaxID=2666085 RepID=A0A7X2IN41_9BURK|nr:helix-turn-helix domain-containing protein [Pseudoduganella rivuli]